MVRLKLFTNGEYVHYMGGGAYIKLYQLRIGNYIITREMRFNNLKDMKMMSYVISTFKFIS